MTTIKIVNRWDSGRVLFECEVPDKVPGGLRMRHALEAAYKARADLRGADLRGVDLRGVDLSGVDLRGADLRGADLYGVDLCDADLRGMYLHGADLSGVDLRGVDLSGVVLSTPDEQAISNLDKVREIILHDTTRLNMAHWHETPDWRNRTCAEETLCRTTHCLAGWLQICSTDPTVRNMNTKLAGVVSAPVAAKMFFRNDEEVLTWLRDRKYVSEIEEGNRQAAERKAKRDAETRGTP